MNSSSSNNKRIFKNTIFLYVRMFIILVVSLYTSRVVLRTLGEVDYGIYNVVGGVVAMLGFLSNTMSSATQRFLSFEIGKGNKDKLKKVFSSSVFLFILFSLVCLILAETIGLWFVYSKMNIPVERRDAAMFVFHFSVMTFVVSIIRIPYNALIIARERMDFYSKISILEVVLKLSIVYLLVSGSFDKLKLYGLLMFTVVLLVTFGYWIFCRLQFEESKLQLKKHDIEIYKGILSFSGWSLFGSLSNMLMDQGVNILLNMFFGPAVNAARGIAYQIKAQVMSFVGGFQTATNPQIIKYYSVGQTDEMKKLLFRGSKITFYLLLLISLPIFIEMEYILSLWLHNTPNWTAIFARLVLLIVLVDSLSGCIIPAIQATAKIKWYQIKVGITKMINLPITFFLFTMGFNPSYAMIVSIFLNFICLFVRLKELNKHIDIPAIEYFKEVVYYDFIVTLSSVTIPTILYMSLRNGLDRFILVCVTSLICTTWSILYIGLKGDERKRIIGLVIKKLKK